MELRYFCAQYGTGLPIKQLDELRSMAKEHFKEEKLATGYSYWNGDKRVLKLASLKESFFVELNFNIPETDGLLVLTEEEAKEMGTGRVRQCYVGSDIEKAKTIIRMAAYGTEGEGNMNFLNAKKIIEDKYIEIAAKEYLKFRKTQDYDEKYKFEILKPMNDRLTEISINSSNVVEIIKYYQSSNPQQGTFVHWSSLDDLKHFAEEQPEEVSRLLNYLYDDTKDLVDRINTFYQAAKHFKNDIRLGVPLFGYLLAAYNLEKYPIYKDGVFREFLKSLQIKEKFPNGAEKYQIYCTVCEMLLNYFETKSLLDNPTILDIQDFIYCIEEYQALKVNISVAYLFYFAKELKLFKDNVPLFIDSIKELGATYLEAEKNKYFNSEKINKIRFEFLQGLLSQEDTTVDELETLKDNVNKNYETNILNSWSNFTILFPIYFDKFKGKVNHELGVIHKAIGEIEEFKDTNFAKGKTINDFTYKQNFGDTYCWVALYPEQKEDHKEAAQMFMGIDHESIRYGLNFGSATNFGLEKDVETISDIDEFSFEKLKNKLKEVYPKFKELNSKEQKALNLDEKIVLLAAEPKAYEVFKPHQEFLKNNDYIMMWYSYPIRNNFIQSVKDSLPINIYQYGTLKDGRRALTHRFVVNDFYTQKGDEGMESPEPEFTLIHEQGKRKMGETKSYICKTWLKVSHIEILEEPISIQEFSYFDNGQEINPSGMVNSFIYAKRQNFSFKYTFEDLQNETYFNPEFLEELNMLLEDKKQIVLFGPPGTGKTYVAERLALYTTQNNDRIRLIQFHPSYCYEEFIEGLRPVTVDKGEKSDLEYQITKGVFRNLCNQAVDEPKKKFVLIIDEINRGNIPKIFGELLYLLEYRGKSVQLPYSQDYFYIPLNVYLIGTMNTSDRSIAALDFALRRRFFFVPLFPDDHPEVLRSWLDKKHPNFKWLAEKYDSLNKLIDDDHIKIGYSYFMCDDLNDKKLDLVWRYNIVPLLKEYYFNDPDKFKEFEHVWFNKGTVTEAAATHEETDGDARE